MPSYAEEDVQNAIAVYRNSDYPLISHTASIFSILTSTLQDRVKKAKARIQSHEKQQVLSSIEEEELII
jgi:hypothetical protein